MKFGRKTTIAAVTLTLAAPVLMGTFNPSSAGTPTSAPLIDKDFEVAMRKFVAKRFFNRIDASTEQREKLSKIMADTQDETRPVREELRQGLLDLSGMMADDKVSDSDIKARVKELRTLHEKVQDRRLAAVLDARKILTPEQKQLMNTKFTELITGGIKPRKIGMLINSAGNILSGE
jgi:Spy/CpxP family protein refolding chaperone